MTSIAHSYTYVAIDPAKLDMRQKSVFVNDAVCGFDKAKALFFARFGATQVAIGVRFDLFDTAAEWHNVPPFPNSPI
ncbi:hypothetical protein PG993_010452 [Apiospora rasikravindrae]|uniref:Uncharacterized protein n=1 Tax=Apiospora rasikravindrae TaxID=990691 RepID=A0ABR1SMC0_9PEZI